MAVLEHVDSVASSYARLGLAPGAPLDEVRGAYRRVVRTVHPDTAADATTDDFVQVRSAYELLRANAVQGSAWRRARAMEAYAPPRRRSRLIDVRA